jgi:hypothetical protein
MTTENSRLAAFAPFLGAWITTGKHPQLPGRTLRGRVSFERTDGGAFVRMRSTSAEADIPCGVAIFGTDDAEGEGTMLYFDERGVSRRYVFELRQGELSWRRDDPAFRQRVTISIHPGGQRLSGRGEMSREGAPWEADLEMEYERVAPSSSSGQPPKTASWGAA